MTQTGNRQLKTQISGRYNYDNPGLFELKKLIAATGADIAFPVGNEILRHEYGFATTVPDEDVSPFWLTETAFLLATQSCDVHVTYNMRGHEEGYIGESTAVETAYALAIGKPTILVRPIRGFSEFVSPVARHQLERHADLVHVIPLDLLNPAEVDAALRTTAAATSSGAVSQRDARIIHRCAWDLVESYRSTWDRKITDEYGPLHGA